MLKRIVAGTLFFLCGIWASAQSNDRLDELLAQAQARLDSTAYLLLVSSGQLDEGADLQQAFEAAVSSGLIETSRHPEDGVSIEELSYLVMKTQNIPGGLVWMFLPNPRAAYRELSYNKIINVSAGPQRLVAGDEVVRTLSAAVALKGAR